MSEIKIKSKFLSGVYLIQGIKGKERAKIKVIDAIKSDENTRIWDTFIKNIKIGNKVIGQIYACNLTSSFIQKSKKYPVYYVDVWFVRSLTKKLLYRMFIYFTLTQKIESVKDLINKSLRGKFTLEMLVDDKLKEIDEIGKFAGNEESINMLEKMVSSKEFNSIHQTLIENENQKIKAKYKNEFETYKTIPKPTINLNDIEID